jgi:Na+/H+-translocating membrane pyrophosphatase
MLLKRIANEMGDNCSDVRGVREDCPMPFRVVGSAASEFREVLRAGTATHRRLRDHLVTIIVLTVGIDLLCAIAAFLLERHSQQTEIKTFGSAAFWTTTQLLTVSSQIKNPISLGGRILDVFMEIWAITVISALAGALGSFLQKRGQEMDETH